MQKHTRYEEHMTIPHEICCYNAWSGEKGTEWNLKSLLYNKKQVLWEKTCQLVLSLNTYTESERHSEF